MTKEALILLIVLLFHNLKRVFRLIISKKCLFYFFIWAVQSHSLFSYVSHIQQSHCATVNTLSRLSFNLLGKGNKKAAEENWMTKR